MDMSAEEIVKIALVLVCNYKLEAMFSVVGGFFWCLWLVLAVEFSG